MFKFIDEERIMSYSSSPRAKKKRYFQEKSIG